MIAFIYLIKGDLEGAARYAAEVRKINKDQVWISYVISQKRGNAVQARRMEKIILSAILPDDRGSRSNRRDEFYNRGTIAIYKGETEQALEYFRQVVSQPMFAWHYSDFEDSLANAYLTLGRFDEAITEYQRILKTNPNYPLASFHIAQAYEAKGMHADARAAYSAFLETWRDADADVPEIITARQFVGD